MKRPLYNYVRYKTPKKHTLALFREDKKNEVELITFEYYKIRTKRITKYEYGNYGGSLISYKYFVYFDDKEFEIDKDDFERINKLILSKHSGA